MHDRENLNLKNMEDLNRQVESMIPSLVNSLLEPDQKASLTITIGFQLCKDSDSHLVVKTKVKPMYPSKGKQILASRNLSGNLSADAYDLGKSPTVRQTGLLDGVATSTEEKE